MTERDSEPGGQIVRQKARRKDGQTDRQAARKVRQKDRQKVSGSRYEVDTR